MFAGIPKPAKFPFDGFLTLFCQFYPNFIGEGSQKLAAFAKTTSENNTFWFFRYADELYFRVDFNLQWLILKYPHWNIRHGQPHREQYTALCYMFYHTLFMVSKTCYFFWIWKFSISALENNFSVKHLGTVLKHVGQGIQDWTK